MVKTDRRTDGQTEIQTGHDRQDGQIDTQTGRTDKQTDTHTDRTGRHTERQTGHTNRTERQDMTDRVDRQTDT